MSKISLRIVIADDEVDMRDYLQKVLPRWGHLVVGVAENGTQLASECRKTKPDLVITDLVMPEQEGIETIRHLHSIYPDLTIIAMSGAFDGAFLKMAKMIGARETLHKPISPKELLTTIKRLVG